jgi:uncharacterized RDD family membrane protein YckC
VRRALSPVLVSPGSSGNVRSAKRTVIHICSQCGALLLEDVDRCSFCDTPLAEKGESPELVGGELVGVTAPARAEKRPGSPTLTREPEWRREVARRLHEYRARRGQLHGDDSQSGLPFLDEIPIDEDPLYQRDEDQLDEDKSVAPISVRPRPVQKQKNERVEICIQPELDFGTAPDYRAHPQTALVPVATLAERRGSGLLDLIFLGLAYAGFLGLFRSLGGELALQKTDAMVYASTFFLFYTMYFSLFITFAGATPGMQLRGLTIVRLDGTLPDTRQLLWRSFGYVLSATTLLLGFLWALWDEDHFTWQDRISQTYVTAATPLMPSASIGVPSRQQRLAHK